MDFPTGRPNPLPPVPKWVPVVYTGLCLVLYAAPLTRILHAESAAIVAAAAWFVSGLSSLSLFARGAPFGRVLTAQLSALAVPWLMLTASLVVAANCGYWQGLLLYVVFAPPSVALSVAIAYALVATRLRYRRTALVAIGLAVALTGCAYDLAFHPQFYVYNHVFGGVLGPVYDEELAVRPGLFAFRGLTLLWAGIAWQVGTLLRGRRLPRAAIALTLTAVGLAYAGSTTLGFNTSYRTIEGALAGQVRTEHFDIRYDPKSLTSEDARRIADDHEYRYEVLARRLDVEVRGRITSYLYPDPDTKGLLTGARRTSVAPVWLARPQVHMLAEHYDRAFPHELAHVFSREFGLPILRASRSAGLVEGLATALEPPDGLPTAHEQMAVQAGIESGIGRRLARRLSPWGFWTGRGAVSYVATGSFVGWLLEAYGPDRLRRVYASGHFETVYGKSAETLAAEWEQYILGMRSIDRAAGDWTSGRFAVESLFKKRCPHHVPRFARRHQEATGALAVKDTAHAEALLLEALRLEPAYEPALADWAGIATATGRARDVVARLGGPDSLRGGAVLTVRLGDAHAALGSEHLARRLYADASELMPAHAREASALVTLRRALARRPGALRTVFAGGDPNDLAALGTADARLFAASIFASHHEYAPALDLLRTADVPSARPLFLQRLAWLSRWSPLAADPIEAAQAAREAALHFEAAGALNEAALHRDLARKADWLLARR